MKNTEFKHDILEEIFLNVKRIIKQESIDHYQVFNKDLLVASLIYNKAETTWTFFVTINNVQSEYHTNLPYPTIQSFYDDIKRIGIFLERK